jgi:two-component system cell cycle response regulator
MGFSAIRDQNGDRCNRDDDPTMKVLIVDDDDLSRMVLAEALHRLGHECEAADGGERAWKLFQENRPDVVISDWMMPDVDGLDLCRLIRCEEGAAYASFILVTGLDDEEHALEGMLAGADDYLAKPLDMKSLKMRLIAADRLNKVHRALADHENELRRLNVEINRTARIDPLTGLGNRLRMQEDLAALDANVDRYDVTYCLGLLDVDCFKSYNDDFGHLAGDRALQAVATVIAREVRGGDVAYRFGGEEFVCIFPWQSQKSTFNVLERIRKAVQALAIPHPGNAPAGVITISAGGSWPVSTGSVRAERPLKEADDALYVAKEGGRNLVVTASHPRNDDERVSAAIWMALLRSG